MAPKNPAPGGTVIVPTGDAFLSQIDQSKFAIPLAETHAVELTMQWLKPVAGSVAVFVPLKRSDDVQEIFPPKKGQEPKPKYVWCCELLGPAVLLKGQEDVQGNIGDVFYMFEPSHPGVRNNLGIAFSNGWGVVLINKGKHPAKSRTYGETLMWQYELRLYPNRVKTAYDFNRVAVPSASNLALLPPAVLDSADT